MDLGSGILSFKIGKKRLKVGAFFGGGKQDIPSRQSGPKGLSSHSSLPPSSPSALDPLLASSRPDAFLHLGRLVADFHTSEIGI